jgi:hypothetical protein
MVWAGGTVGFRAWLVAGIGGVVAIGALLVLFHGPRGPAAVPAPAKEAPAVGVARIDAAGNSLLREEAMLRDPTPLFLPTRWSAGENALPRDDRREPGSSFADFPAKFAFETADLKWRLPPPVAIPARPAEAFATDRPKRPFIGFGEGDPEVTPLKPRGAFVKIVAENDGRVAFAEALPSAKPPGDAAWEPMEFLVAIDRAGVVSPPVVTESSRVAAVDAYFQNCLTDKLHVGERLRPGFYRVSIGP